MENVFRTLLKPVSYFFPTAITTPVEVVAHAMINNALSNVGEKVEMYENKAIHQISGISKGKYFNILFCLVLMISCKFTQFEEDSL